MVRTLLRSRFLGCHATTRRERHCVTSQKTAAKETSTMVDLK